MQIALILLAGGRGTRMGSGIPDKILASLDGMPVFRRVWETFAGLGWERIVVVYRDEAQRGLLEAMIDGAMPAWVRGGEERMDSVRNALAVLEEGCSHVLIHDCARPWVRREEILRMVEAVGDHPVVSLAHRVTDTIRDFRGNPTREPAISKTLDRSSLWAMETPQGFELARLKDAYARAESLVTDDIALLEAAGFPVFLVENEHPNPKMTRESDLHWTPLR
jgi:2-C-methyl-D-erythritol 4-phosphate cytidylyltransferase